MIPPSGHFEFYAGDTHAITGQLLDDNAQPVDITSPDDYIIFTARRTPKSPIAIEYRAEKVNPAMGNFLVGFKNEDFAQVAFETPTSLVFDLLHVSGTHHRTFTTGTINVYPRVNNADQSSR